MFRRGYQVVCGVALIVIAAFFLVSIIGYNHADYALLLANAPVKNYAGPAGAWTGHILRSLFGIASYLFIVAVLIPACFCIKSEWVGRATEKTVLLLLLTAGAAALISLFIHAAPQLSGGYAGMYISGFCFDHFGRTASYALLSTATLINTVILVILFLSPQHERFETSSTFSGRLKTFANRIPFLRRYVEGPVIGIDDPRRGKRAAFPWIIKKKILVYETEKIDELLDTLKYPLLPDSPPERKFGLITDRSDDTDARFPEETVIDDDDTDANAAVVLSEDEYIVECGADKESYDPGVLEGGGGTEGVEEYAADAGAEDAGLSPDTVFESDEEDQGSAANQEPLQQRAPGIESAYPAEFAERVFEEIPINNEYIIPTSYLTSSKPLDSESWKNEIRKNSALLKNTLAEFGIEAEVVNVNRGPVITLYEMQIAPGIKVNRVAGLADDIAMALAAQRVRIVAPIPGKSAIGVEIPNRYRETVTLGDIIKSKEFQSYEGSLVVALGKDILGNPVMLDLKRLPHLLIAGTTGSGKSVCVNSIIASLLYNYDPNYVRFILVDPKMVELQLYSGIPHLLTPVIVDPMVAPMVLKWTMHEMERRYCLMSEMNTRDIERYNEKVDRYGSGLEKLPYIVIIIDEMADLMMTSKEVEGYITRIAQKSRAIGIHLVVATQRPSVDIITGLIKANFPARVAFQVAQKTDSRTIIDQNGAEKLLGRGDMLYQSPTSSFTIRIQGGFISEEEIEKIAAHLCALGKPSYIDIEESLLDVEESKDLDEATDELFQEALKIVEESKKASASYLQRRLSIGYNRAARIIEHMEEMGYIGPQIGSKPREVFI